jgi:hypothetical protein
VVGAEAELDLLQATKLRVSSPAVVSSTTTSATCAPTSSCRVRCPAGRGAAAAALAQRAGEVGARRLERRDEAERDAGGGDHAECRGEHRAVDPDLVEARDVGPGRGG